MTIRDLDLDTIFFLMIHARNCRKISKTRRDRWFLKRMYETLSWTLEEATKAQYPQKNNVVNIQDYLR